MYKRRKQVDNCMLCEQPFTKALTLLNRNPVRHCKKCAKSICEVCSENKRQLSKNDPEKYRVCDQCDFDMSNWKLKDNLMEVQTITLEKLEMLNSHIEQLAENKEMLFERDNQEKEKLEQTLTEQYEEREKLKTKLDENKKEVGAQSNARNSLHQSICDLEKVIGDFDIEQRRLKTKQSTLLA